MARSFATSTTEATRARRGSSQTVSWTSLPSMSGKIAERPEGVSTASFGKEG